ncbi:MAG TPA: hypothetical protein VFP19_10055 [Candidatus Limnocylindrales bacterium]|nr:hypothetical protein [Candidatus Limnocylindrales bacterium]
MIGRPGRRGSILVLALAGVLAACAPAASPVPSASPQAASPGASFPASPVDGVILSVDASSLTDVRGFTLLTRDGQRIAFTLGTLEDPTAFPPGHLAEHQATSDPVRVYFRVENGQAVVYRLADASGSPAPS